MGMRASSMDDNNEGAIRLRERVAVMDQRMTNIEATTQRQIDNQRTYLDEKFANLKNEMKLYVDQKFMEMDRTIRVATPSTAQLDQKVWITLLIIGLLAAMSVGILALGGAPWTR